MGPATNHSQATGVGAQGCFDPARGLGDSVKEFYLLSTIYLGPNGIVVLAASDMKTLARAWAEWAPVPLDTKRVQRITISEGWPKGKRATVLEDRDGVRVGAKRRLPRRRRMEIA